MSAQAPAAPAAEAPKKKKGKKLMFIALAAVLVAAGGAAAWYFSASDKEGAKAEAQKKLPMQYFAMEPSFVVNLADTDTVRYLQADVQLATRDPETLAALQAHGPALRNRLLLLFGQQVSSALAQRSGKERLQEKALAEVKSVLKAEAAPDKVEAVMFTSLVTQ